jgi:hypothetical protein
MKHDVRELSMIEKPQQMLHGNQSGPMKIARWFRSRGAK